MQYGIIQRFISQNRSYENLNSSGCVVHETADAGATAEKETEYFNEDYRGASAHAFVDWTMIVQNIPWDEVAWHAGPTTNSMFWGIELCRPRNHDPVKFNAVWKKGVWLFAYLFTKVANPQITEVTKLNLMSHAETSDTWNETDHRYPDAYFAEYGLNVDDFRNAVQECIKTGNIYDVASGGSMSMLKPSIDYEEKYKYLLSELKELVNKYSNP